MRPFGRFDERVRKSYKRAQKPRDGPRLSRRLETSFSLHFIRVLGQPFVSKMGAVNTVAVLLMLFSILDPFTLAAPSKRSAGLQACVGKALIGSDAAGRIITPSDAEYEAASSGAIL